MIESKVCSLDYTVLYHNVLHCTVYKMNKNIVVVFSSLKINLCLTIICAEKPTLKKITF